MIRASALVALVITTSACGRLGFDLFGEEPAPLDGPSDGPPDGQACAPVGHDEDGDGVDDACDVCPQFPGPQDDRDGDGVGDPCDPHPDQPVDRIELFDPFVTADSSWTFNNPENIAFENDRLHATDDSVMSRAHADGNDTFAFFATVNQQLMPGAFIIMLSDGTDANYYCEVQVGGGYAQLTVEAEPGMYVAADNTALGDTNLVGKNVSMSMTMRTGGWSCASTLGNDAYFLDGARPIGITPDRLVFFLYDLDVEVWWFLHIHSDL